MKILIVRLSALGDIVHALPVLSALRRATPAGQHRLAGRGKLRGDSVDCIRPSNRRIIVRATQSFQSPDAVSFGGTVGYVQAVSYLRAEHYDAAVDLQGLIKSAMWARLSGAARVIGFDAAHLREPQAASCIRKR